MNKVEIIDKLSKHGIHQLRKGETVKDALDYVDGKRRSRKGYKHKKRDGSAMSKNEIISASNKEAFARTIKNPVPSTSSFCGVPVEDIHPEDLEGIEDYRQDTTKVGEIEGCHYCNEPLRVDKEGCYDILNCEDCHSFSVMVNCM